MKTLMVILLSTVTFYVTSQIKVFPGGLQSYGSTASPASGEKHKFTGDMVISSSATPTLSAIRLRGNNGYSAASTPDYTWLGNDQTGLFHPASNIIGFTINGTEKWRIHTNGQLLSSLSSAAATPDYSFYNDQNTGIFNAGADLLGFSAGGTERFRMNGSGQLLNGNTISSSSTPDYSWNNDNSTGMFHAGNYTIGFATVGVERVKIKNSYQVLIGGTLTNPISPGFSWDNDPNTGIFTPGADMVGISTGGTERMRVDNTGNVLIGTTTSYNYNNSRLTTSAANNVALVAATSQTVDYGYCQINYVNRENTKAFAVHNNSSGSYTETFAVLGSGDAWAKTVTIWSDRNLKENFDSLQSSLDKIKQLKGMKYNFKASFVGNGPPETEIGLIAQDVEQVLPEVVETNDKGIKGIKYSSIIPVLIEAIKELDAKNSRLESELNSCCSKGDTKTRMMNITDGSGSQESESSYLMQNKPNPFNKESVIEYNVVESGSASILVFDMNGKLLKTIPVKIPGKGSITISANDFAAGMYYYSLIVNDKEVDTKKMILTQ